MILGIDDLDTEETAMRNFILKARATAHDLAAMTAQLDQERADFAATLAARDDRIKALERSIESVVQVLVGAIKDGEAPGEPPRERPKNLEALMEDIGRLVLNGADDPRHARAFKTIAGK